MNRGPELLGPPIQATKNKQGWDGKIQRFSSIKPEYLENGSRYGQVTYGLSIDIKIDDLGWPWTAVRSNVLGISRHFSCFGGTNVLSRLDYGNSTLAGVSSYLSSRLQSVMNTAARLIFFLVKVPAHHSAPSSAALAEGSRADCIQTISPRVQVSTRRTRGCICIPYWRALWGCQMSRLVSDSVPVHLHHWLSAAPDSLLSVTELFLSPLHVSGTVCLILSLPHLL